MCLSSYKIKKQNIIKKEKEKLKNINYRKNGEN